MISSQLKAVIRLAKYIKVDLYQDQSGEYVADAPLGYIFKVNECHCAYRETLDDIHDVLLTGIEPCTIENCDICEDNRDNKMTPESFATMMNYKLLSGSDQL